MGSHYYADGAMHEEVRPDRRQRHPHLADVELRGCRPPPHAAPPAPRGQADPAALGARARPDGRRYGPIPLMPTFDAYDALERMCKDERCY